MLQNSHTRVSVSAKVLILLITYFVSALGVDNMNIKLFDLSPIKKMKPKETPCSVSPSQDSPKDLEMVGCTFNYVEVYNPWLLYTA